MIILKGKSNSGKTTGLIRRFCEAVESATLITDVENLTGIFNKMNFLQDQEELIISDGLHKNIITGQFTNCDADYYNIINNSLTVKSVYLDLEWLPNKIKPNIIKFCLDLENEYGVSFTMTEREDGEFNPKSIKKYRDKEAFQVIRICKGDI